MDYRTIKIPFSLWSGVLACIATALQLEGLSTKKPRTTKYSSKAVAPITDSPSTVSIYRVNNTKGTTCILIRTDGILDITYRTILNEDIVANTFLPDDVDLSGDCSEEDVSSMTMKFKGFTIYMVFKKTPGGERWYVSNVELSYSSSNPLLKQIDRPGLQVFHNVNFLHVPSSLSKVIFISNSNQVKLSTPVHNTLLFPTPVGKSYTCDEQDIILYSRVSPSIYHPNRLCSFVSSS